MFESSCDLIITRRGNFRQLIGLFIKENDSKPLDESARKMNTHTVVTQEEIPLMSLGIMSVNIY